MRPFILFLVIQVLFSFSSFAGEVTSSDENAQEYVEASVKKTKKPTLEEKKKQEIEAKKLAQKKRVKPQCAKKLAGFQKIIEKQEITANYPKNISKLLKKSHWKAGKKAFRIGITRKGHFILSTPDGKNISMSICSGNEGVFTAHFYYGMKNRQLAVKTDPKKSSNIHVYSSDPDVQDAVGGNYRKWSQYRYNKLITQLEEEKQQNPFNPF